MKVWFSNRRAKWRKTATPENANSFSTMAAAAAAMAASAGGMIDSPQAQPNELLKSSSLKESLKPENKEDLVNTSTDLVSTLSTSSSSSSSSTTNPLGGLLHGSNYAGNFSYTNYLQSTPQYDQQQVDTSSTTNYFQSPSLSEFNYSSYKTTNSINTPPTTTTTTNPNYFYSQNNYNYAYNYDYQAIAEFDKSLKTNLTSYSGNNNTTNVTTADSISSTTTSLHHSPPSTSFSPASSSPTSNVTSSAPTSNSLYSNYYNYKSSNNSFYPINTPTNSNTEFNYNLQQQQQHNFTSTHSQYY